MIKFFLYLSICISLIYYSIQTTSNPFLETVGKGEYSIYSTERISSNLVTKKIDTGIGFIYSCDSTNATKLRKQFTKIDGESIVLSSVTPKEILSSLGYQQVSETTDSYARIIYAFSNRGKTFIKLGATKVNLQIAERGNTLVVGWPVILGSY